MWSFGAEFDVGPGYVNTPAIGVPPRSVVDAVQASVAAWATGRASPPEFDAAVATARSAFASLVGVPVSSVAIGDVVSSMIGLVAASLPHRARVLTAARQFTSVSFPFAAQGHEVVETDLTTLPEQAAAFDVVAVSVVSSADGALLDLEALRAQRGHALVVLDATQSLGWLPARTGLARRCGCRRLQMAAVPARGDLDGSVGPAARPGRARRGGLVRGRVTVGEHLRAAVTAGQ